MAGATEDTTEADTVGMARGAGMDTGMGSAATIDIESTHFRGHEIRKPAKN